ncbi:hypothetical protein HY224_01335 [Candidatus Uhrbacteria bacterium]|nr:hypothetical protein [Candidatus Uhrbacteria bacterium]
MGSTIEINDTLRLTVEQGFPSELDFKKHTKGLINVLGLSKKIFEFKNKPGIRAYHQPPVRNFLVENHGGRWLYWGLIHILEVHHDFVNQTTSGRYKIIYLYTPQEMKKAHELVDRNPKTK